MAKTYGVASAAARPRKTSALASKAGSVEVGEGSSEVWNRTAQGKRSRGGVNPDVSHPVPRVPSPAPAGGLLLRDSTFGQHQASAALPVPAHSGSTEDTLCA